MFSFLNYFYFRNDTENLEVETNSESNSELNSESNSESNIYNNQNIYNDVVLNYSTKLNTNYIPPKFERSVQNDLIIKYLTLLIITLDGLVFFGSIQKSQFIKSNVYSIINFFFIILFFILNVSWLHYKLQHIVIGAYKLFMNLNIFKTNSKYYSGLEIPDCFININYPNITIQLPVYKEDLHNTIKPTINNAIIQAKRYIKETGADCNIIVCDDGLNLISEDDKKERKKFYLENNIGYTARPHPSKYKRIGRFKKAGNLNFSLNYSEIAILKTQNIEESNQNNEIIKSKHFDEIIELGGIFQGDLVYGSYIFLIDSDTRLPNFSNEENGCFKRLIKDMLFDGDNTVLYMQCFTGPYLSTKSISEKCVFHFTCHIYNGILIGTALNSMAPLVGHNALLNFRLLKEIAEVNDDTNYYYYWGEDKISEDFDCMLRGCKKGYIGRYIGSAGIFLEGVSFTYMTEYFKVSKFACGAAELTFNPISKWFSKDKDSGFFSQDIIGFICCKEIEWYNKISIIAYILNFIAIAQAHLAMFYNLFFFEELFNVLPYGLLPVNLMWEGTIVWGVINTIINLLFARRVKFNSFIVLRQQMRELFFTSSLYGSLSVRFSIMYISHIFNLNVIFGATQKDDEQIKLMDWIKSTKYECCIYTFYFICIIIRVFVFPIKSYIHTFYFGGLPLLMNIFWYWFGPLVYDILPKRTNKTETPDYNKEELMFIDKYNTQIPNSEIFSTPIKKINPINFNKNINKIFVNF